MKGEVAARVRVTKGTPVPYTLELIGCDWHSEERPDIAEAHNLFMEWPGPSEGDPVTVLAWRTAEETGGEVTFIRPPPDYPADAVF